MFVDDENVNEEPVEEVKEEKVEDTKTADSVEVEATKVESNTTSNTEVKPKSKMAAGLLGIFLGCFGVHNFYLGYTGKAVGQLLITVLSCFILSPISAIWGLIEGIMILSGSINTDAEGNELVD